MLGWLAERRCGRTGCRTAVAAHSMLFAFHQQYRQYVLCPCLAWWRRRAGVAAPACYLLFLLLQPALVLAFTWLRRITRCWRRLVGSPRSASVFFAALLANVVCGFARQAVTMGASRTGLPACRCSAVLPAQYSGGVLDVYIFIPSCSYILPHLPGAFL